MAGKTLSYFNLTGGLNTVQTMATINSSTNRTESPDMVNIEYFKLSGIRTMNGNVGLNSSSSIGNSPIRFGYEYVKGNSRYLIVADERNLYEYNSLTDSFTTLNAALRSEDNYTFYTGGGEITICGYANGIVAASTTNNYLIYYRKDRDSVSLGQVTGDGSTTVIINTYGSPNATCSEDILGKGDIIVINDSKYEVETVQPAKIQDSQNPSQWIPNPDKDKFTVTEVVPSGSSNFSITNFTKIYCTYTSIVNNGDNTTKTTTTNFIPKVIQSHQGRLWVGARLEDEETAAYLIYSDLGNINNAFEGGDASAYDAGYFAEFWEDTSDITAIGTWDKYIVCHKTEHTYLIDTSNSDATQWKVESYSEYTCDNQQGFVKANNGYYTYCSTVGGIYPMIQRTIYSAISQGAEASTKIRDTFLNLNTYSLDKIFAVYHPYKKYIMFYMPMIGETGSNNCYILDLQTKSWLHRRIPQVVTSAFEFDNKVYVGTADGKVFEEFRGTTFDGQPIEFSWKSPWFIWGGMTNWTTTREFRVKMSQEGTNNFFIRNRRDGTDDYKQRTITNTSNQVTSLLWDSGALTDDKEPITTSWDIYKHIGADGEKYYSLDKILQERYSWMFKNKEDVTYLPSGKAKSASSLAYRTESTASDYDAADWSQGTKFAFKYTPTVSQYICYRSTKDSNIKAWLTRTSPSNLDTSRAMVNVKDKIGTDYICVNGYIWSGGGTTNQDLYIEKSDFEKYWNVKNQKVKAYTYNSNTGAMQHTATINGMTVYWWLYTNECKTGWTTPTNGGRYVAFGDNSTTVLIYINLTRKASNDKHLNDKVEEVWNGNSKRSGKYKTVSSYSTNSIVIDGVTFNRYTAGDEGTLADETNAIIVYANTKTLSVGQSVYNEPALTNEYGKVSSVNGTNYNIEGRVFVPSPSDNDTGGDTVYYKIAPVFPDIGTTTYTGTPTGDTVTYNPFANTTFYPNEAKILTDSKWDKDRWVNTGQITKRFPIDRQYFQTLQIEFCGETEDQGIELYGFEIDGIQLTEVPW